MWEIFKKQIPARIASLFFGIYSFWWLYFTFSGVSPDIQYKLFTVTYGLIAIWGSYWGFRIARSWGGFRSVMGKSIMFFTIGLALQEVGQLGYTYYIYFLNIEVPYPSWGDLAFYGSIPCYIVGVIYLARASGIHLTMKSYRSKLQAVLVPLIMLILSYLIFLQGYNFDWSNPLKVIIDFGAPLGQSIYISLAILTYTLTRGVLGGVMKVKVLFILFALFAQYIADWTFLYQASRGTWTVSGVNDYMYFCAYFAMTLGLLGLSLKSINNKIDEH